MWTMLTGSKDNDLEAVKTITYVLNITSSTEMNKSALKHMSKSHSLQLSMEKAWDTVKAQILKKISLSLHPQNLNFNDYTILFYIMHLVSKSGMPLTKPEEYMFMIEQARKLKTPLVNVTIMENKNENDTDKENEDRNEEDERSGLKKKGSKVCVCVNYLVLIESDWVWCFRERKHHPYTNPMLKRLFIFRHSMRSRNAQSPSLFVGLCIATSIPIPKIISHSAMKLWMHGQWEWWV
jgi:hypothetical protein